MTGKKPGVGLDAFGLVETRFFRPNGTATFDKDFADEAFDLAEFGGGGALRVQRDSVAWSETFLGGRRGTVELPDGSTGVWGSAEPQLGAENEFAVGNRCLMAAFNAGRPSFEGLPFQWIGNTEEWTGVPNDYERLLFCFGASPTSSFVRRWYEAVGDPQGQLPTNPFIASQDLRFPEGRRADGSYYLYFIAPNPIHKGANYWKHGTVDGKPTGEIWGYEPGYPEVFGPMPKPLSSGGGKDPVSTTLTEKQRLSKIYDLVDELDELVASGKPGGAPIQKLRNEVRKVLSDMRNLAEPVALTSPFL